MLSRRVQILCWLSLSICICTCYPLIYSGPALAATDSITVASRTELLAFPRSIVFQISAHDATALLTQATIYIKYGTGESFQESHTVVASTRAHTARFRWQDDFASYQGHFSPAGTQISYYWIIADSANTLYTDSIEGFQVSDNRFHWQHLTQGFCQVNWYNRPLSFGQTILAAVSMNIQRISQNLGGGLHLPINLWIYQTRSDFQSALPPLTHEWVGGVAFPLLNQASIVIGQTSDETLVSDMPHELTHLIFHQLVAPDVAPLWFDEGLAVYNQEYHESAMTLAFQQALHSHELLPLSSISYAFPSDTDGAYLAYAQSWKMLDYMYRTFGRQKMTLLIRSMDTHTRTFDEDISLITGMSMAHLENAWRSSLGQRRLVLPRHVILPVDTGSSIATLPYCVQLLLVCLFFLSAVALCGLGGLIIYQRRERTRRRMLAACPSCSVADRRSNVYHKIE